MADQPPTSLQRTFWNGWNASYREHGQGGVSLEQADVVIGWLRRLGRTDLEIIEIGCGAGWLCSRLAPFGRVTGTDLSDEVLARARKRAPDVEFVEGDFMTLDLGHRQFDVAVSLEVLSHVADQAAFLGRAAEFLRPRGRLMLATQNRPALERNQIPPPAPGQLRRWVDRHELARLLAPRFCVEELFSITPSFNRGTLRLLNSGRVQRIASRLRLGAAHRAMVRLEERLWLGWTLMALARKT